MYENVKISKIPWTNQYAIKLWEHINWRNSPKIGRGNINTDRLVPYVPASQEANESQKDDTLAQNIICIIKGGYKKISYI